MITSILRVVPFVWSILICACVVCASEIREFDIKTIERLGNELTQLSQTRDRGASTPVKKRARKTAIAALKGRLFDIRYDYVVLDDPDGSGFLVYALGKGSKRGDIVIHGHFRVMVSSDGEKAERVDALSHTRNDRQQERRSLTARLSARDFRDVAEHRDTTSRNTCLCEQSHELTLCGRHATKWPGLVDSERQDYER
jgi:hypothetical protein